MHPLSQVFSKTRMSESNYSSIKDKDVTREGATTQRRRSARGQRVRAPYPASDCRRVIHDQCNKYLC